MSLVRFRFWAFINFKCHFCFIIHIMALYGRASNSTYSLFLTSGQISHLLAYIPHPVLECVAFSALSCFYTPAPLLAAWLFHPFLASIPPHLSLGRGFFRRFPFLCPICIVNYYLYMDMFCHHTQKNSLIRVCLFDKFFTVS